jgi:hypothetical protein
MAWTMLPLLLAATRPFSQLILLNSSVNSYVAVRPRLRTRVRARGIIEYEEEMTVATGKPLIPMGEFLQLDFPLPCHPG